MEVRRLDNLQIQSQLDTHATYQGKVAGFILYLTSLMLQYALALDVIQALMVA